MRTIVCAICFVIWLGFVQANNITAFMCKDSWDCKQCLKVKNEGQCKIGFHSGVCYKTCTGCGPYVDEQDNCASIAKQGKCFVRNKGSFNTPAMKCEKSCCSGAIVLPTPSRPYWDEWSFWGSCSKTCRSGFRKRTRSCNSASDGSYCKGYSTEFQVCNRGISCSTVDGGWSTWSMWSSCQSSCGVGTKMRTRQCSNPWPQNNGKPCRGIHQQAKRCNAGCCPGAGSWGAWSTWGSCNCSRDSYGYGNRERTRLCDNPKPSCGGTSCQGQWKETQRCSTLCPTTSFVPVWSAWSKWSSCSQTCGYGYRDRTRKCIKWYKGYKHCRGHAREYDWCNKNIPCY